MTAYYQEKVEADMLASSMTRLSKMGYTIFSVQPYFAQNLTRYIIIYYR